jgi:hypothetical protein
VRRLLAAFCIALALPALVHAASNPVLDAAKRTAAAKSVTFQVAVTTKVARRQTTMMGAGAGRGTSVRLSLRSRGQGAFRMDMVIVREHGRYVMYVRSPDLQALLPPGKKWVRYDLANLTGLGMDFSSLMSISQTFAPLEKGLVSTVRIGHEAVAGRPTTHYRAVIDIHRAARAAPAYAKEVAALERAAGIRLGRVPYHVWIGTDDRFRRLRFSMPTVVVNGVRGKVAETMTFLSFNTPVTITAPPRSQVFSP